ncbi:MAG: hypothetical protein ABSG63_01030 [Spirochaetia bacterium]|jgi:hypothetical protein
MGAVRKCLGITGTIAILNNKVELAISNANPNDQPYLGVAKTAAFSGDLRVGVTVGFETGSPLFGFFFQDADFSHLFVLTIGPGYLLFNTEQ